MSVMSLEKLFLDVSARIERGCSSMLDRSSHVRWQDHSFVFLCHLAGTFDSVLNHGHDSAVSFHVYLLFDFLQVFLALDFADSR